MGFVFLSFVLCLSLVEEDILLLVIVDADAVARDPGRDDGEDNALVIIRHIVVLALDQPNLSSPVADR